MMTVALVMTLCAAGIAFYVRFLIALYRESRRAKIGYVVELEVGDDGQHANQEKSWHRLGMSTLEPQ